MWADALYMTTNKPADTDLDECSKRIFLKSVRMRKTRKGSIDGRLMSRRKRKEGGGGVLRREIKEDDDSVSRARDEKNDWSLAEETCGTGRRGKQQWTRAAWTSGVIYSEDK